MRRRALLAASHTGGNNIIYDKILGELPPESTKFEWPLYINLPFEGEYDRKYEVVYEYIKGDDIILQQLSNWLEENKVLVNDDGWMKNYEVYPPELYVNGLRVITCYQDVDRFGSYDWVVCAVSPEHIADCITECSLTIDGQLMTLLVLILK